MCVVGYIDIGGASCPGIGGLNVCITGIVKYIYVGGASCLGNRGTKYFCKLRIRMF
jgi:hypothetical protein